MGTSVTTEIKGGINRYDLNNESQLKDGDGKAIPVENALTGGNLGGSFVLKLPLRGPVHFVFGADGGYVFGESNSYNDVFGEANYTGVDCDNVDPDFEPNCVDPESTLSSYYTSTDRAFIAPKAGLSVDILQMPKGKLRADAYVGYRFNFFDDDANAFLTSEGGVNNTVPSDLSSSREFFLQAEVGIPIATLGDFATVELGVGGDVNLGGMATVYNRGQELGADVVNGTAGGNVYALAGVRWGKVQTPAVYEPTLPSDLPPARYIPEIEIENTEAVDDSNNVTTVVIPIAITEVQASMIAGAIAIEKMQSDLEGTFIDFDWGKATIKEEDYHKFVTMVEFAHDNVVDEVVIWGVADNDGETSVARNTKLAVARRDLGMKEFVRLWNDMYPDETAPSVKGEINPMGEKGTRGVRPQYMRSQSAATLERSRVNSIINDEFVDYLLNHDKPEATAKADAVIARLPELSPGNQKLVAQGMIDITVKYYGSDDILAKKAKAFLAKKVR